MAIQSPHIRSLLSMVWRLPFVTRVADMVFIFLMWDRTPIFWAAVNLQYILCGAVGNIKCLQCRSSAKSSLEHHHSYPFPRLLLWLEVLLQDLEQGRGPETVAFMGIHIWQYVQCTQIALHLAQFLQQCEFHTISTFNTCGHLPTSP